MSEEVTVQKDETAEGKKPEIGGEEGVEITIKNPSDASDSNFVISVSPTSSIGDVKNLLHRIYKGNPDPSRQKIIVAGKVLPNDLTIIEVYKQKNPDSPRVMHLVISSIPFGASSSKSNSLTPVRAYEGRPEPSRSFSLDSRSSRASSITWNSPPPDRPLTLTNSSPPTNSKFLEYHSSERPALPSTLNSSSSAPSPSVLRPNDANPPPRMSTLPELDSDPTDESERPLLTNRSESRATPPTETQNQIPPFPGFNPNVPFPGPYGGLPFGLPFSPFPPPYMGGGFPLPLNPQSDVQGTPEDGPGSRTNGALPFPQPPFGMMPFYYPFPFPYMPGIPHGGALQSPWGMYYPIPHAQEQPAQIPAQGQVPAQPGQLNAIFNAQPAVPGPVNAAPRRQGRVILALRLDLLLIFKLVLLVLFFNQNGTWKSTFLFIALATIYYLYHVGALAPFQQWTYQFMNQFLGVRVPQAPNPQPNDLPQQPNQPPQQPPQNQPEPQNQPQQPPQPVNELRQEEISEHVAPGEAAGTNHPQEQPPQEQPEAQPPRAPRRRGFFREIHMFFAGFIFSLLPGLQFAGVHDDLNHPHQD